MAFACTAEERSLTAINQETMQQKNYSIQKFWRENRQHLEVCLTVHRRPMFYLLKVILFNF